MTGSYPPDQCGVGDYTGHLAAALAAREGLEVAVLTSRRSDLRRSSTNAALFEDMETWRLKEIGRLFRRIRQWRADVVHLQYPAQGYRSMLLPSLVPLVGLLGGARVVRTWHEPASWGRLSDWRGLIVFMLQALAPGAFVIVRPNFPELIHRLLAYLPWPRRYRFIASASAIPVYRGTAQDRAALREQMLCGAQRLIVFFGFLAPNKGAEQLFHIADPSTDRIIFMGGAQIDADYSRSIEEMASAEPWRGKVSFRGFCTPEIAASTLASADAVVLPFREGGGIWNSSIHAARRQGTLVVTTSNESPGYDRSTNTATAMPDDISGLKKALDAYCGARRDVTDDQADDWARVAEEHARLYAEITRR